MSNIYYPESWMQHPEVLRLQQYNREWSKTYVEQQKEIEKLKKELHIANCDLDHYKQKYTVADARYKKAQEEIKELEQQMDDFNRLPFIRKAIFHFKIK